MQTLSVRAQSILDLLADVMRDLAFELRNDYDEVDIKLSISAE